MHDSVSTYILLPPPCHFENIATASHFWHVFYIFPAAGLLLNDQQQEGGGSSGGDTLIMLRNHMDTILMLSPPLTITTTSYNYLSSKSRQLL